MNTNLFLKKYVLSRVLIIMLILQISRVLFYFFNKEMFQGSLQDALITIIKSLLFDLLSTFLYFSIYLLLVIIFLFFRKMKIWQLYILDLYFTFLFWLTAILSFADIYYYKFNLRRINLEALDLLKDSYTPILNFAKHNISSCILLIAVITAFILISKRILSRRKEFDNQIPLQKNLVILVAFIAASTLLFGRYNKYFSPLSASLIVQPGYTGLYTNSPQVFLYSFRSGWTYVEPLHYFSDKAADERVKIFHSYPTTNYANNRNIIIFILESFSYSYLDKNNPDKPPTPFFDSLINHSTFFTKAYANNTTSANGLCSILSGIPSLMNQPFFSSAYANNPVQSICQAINKRGYSTHFFMGTNDDHFGFKKGTKLLGINNYHNGESLPKSMHDGTWGIYDEPYLQYFAQNTNNGQQPFFSIFFTISSHYPFNIPDSLKNNFATKNNYPDEKAVAYVDYAFRKYFESVKNTGWFQNTIFIFTADHVSKENKREKKTFNFNTYYHIPIFIFDPQNPRQGTVNHVVQHTDFPVTIAQLLNIPDTVLSFGNSFFDTASYHYTINRTSENIIQMIDSNTLIQYDIINNKLLDIYFVKLNGDIEKTLDPTVISEIERTKVPILKAYMQQYFNRLHYNKLFIKNKT